MRAFMAFILGISIGISGGLGIAAWMNNHLYVKPKTTVFYPGDMDKVTTNPCEYDTMYAQRKGDTIRIEFHYWTRNIKP